MAESMSLNLSAAESSALALEQAAAELDQATNADDFLRALERNHQVWQTLADLAVRQKWSVPSRSMADYAINTARSMGRGANDEHVHALIDINRRISAELAGGDIQRIRRRAHEIWEMRGRPMGQDIEHWLLAEMECRDGH